MRRSDFAGLTILAPAEPLSTDGFSFQNRNPEVIDRLLKVGAVTHKHDEHVALDDPADAPTADLVTTAGSFPAELDARFGYTLIDAFGGETAISPLVEVATPSKIAPPDAPVAAADYTAGGLLSGTYSYVKTWTDGAGGETTAGMEAIVRLDPGHANGQIQFTALMTGIPAGATGWRIYKSANGTNYHLIASGATATLTDDGTLCADCVSRPPTQNTTLDHNTIDVIMPGVSSIPVEAVAFRLYGSVDAGFSSPSFFGQYARAQGGDTFSFAAFNPGDGAPPAISTAVPGASKIDPDTDMVDWRWKRPVADLASLPPTGNTLGDVRETLDDLAFHVWDGAAWVDMSAGGGGGSPEAWTDISTLGTLAANFRSISDSDYDVNWHDDGRVVAVASFYKDPGGEVHMKGGLEVYGVTPSAFPLPTRMFTLPVGYRPGEQRRFSVDYLDHRGSGGAFDFVNHWWRLFVEIRTNGEVWLRFNAAPMVQYDGSASWTLGDPDDNDQISLEAISFRAA